MKIRLIIPNGQDRRELASILSEAGYPNYVEPEETTYTWEFPVLRTVITLPDEEGVPTDEP